MILHDGNPPPTSQRHRTSMTGLHLLALLTLATTIASSASASPIVMTRGTLSSAVRDGTDARDQVFSFANLLPSYEVVTASAGATSMTTIRDWRVAPDDTTTLGFEFEHMRSGDFGSFTDGMGVQFSFIAEQTLWFDLTGFFALDGGEFIEFSADLVDRTTGTTLFSNIQQSEATADQRFELGGQAGDLNNELTGRLSGVLNAGSEYALSYRTLLNTRVVDDGASGRGGVWLTIRTTPMPEPSTLALMGLGLACVIRHPRSRPRQGVRTKRRHRSPT